MNQRFGRKRASNKGFGRTADMTHFMNVKTRPQRGGIRL